MGVNSLPKTVTRQRRGCNLNPGPSAPESSTLTTQLPSHPNINHGLTQHHGHDNSGPYDTSANSYDLMALYKYAYYTHTHARLMALCPGLPG